MLKGRHCDFHFYFIFAHFQKKRASSQLLHTVHRVSLSMGRFDRKELGKGHKDGTFHKLNVKMQPQEKKAVFLRFFKETGKSV